MNDHDSYCYTSGADMQGGRGGRGKVELTILYDVIGNDVI